MEIDMNNVELNEKGMEKLPFVPVVDGEEKSSSIEVKLTVGETIKFTEIDIKDVEPNLKEIEDLPLATTLDSAEKYSMVGIKMAKMESERVNKIGIKDLKLSKNDTEIDDKTDNWSLTTMVGSGDNIEMVEVKAAEKEEMKVSEMYDRDEDLREYKTVKLEEEEMNVAREEALSFIDIDMEDIELNEMDSDLSEDLERLPLAIGVVSTGTKGTVYMEVEERVKFTDLSKEELLKVARRPVWVCTRWALLILVFLGWLGMLAGAIVILLHAPHCKELPKLRWWQKGVIYQIGTIEDFQDSNGDGIRDLAGIQLRLDDLKDLKVKGLVIGPIHVTSTNSPKETRLKEVDLRFGTLTNFIQLLGAARKKNIRVILDLTPNYKGKNSWFNTNVMSNNTFQSDFKEAVSYWLENGVDGIQVGGIENLKNLDLLEEWKNITINYSTAGNSRILVAASDDPSSENILSLMNETNCDVLSSHYLLGLEELPSGKVISRKIENYITAAGLRWMSWSVGGPKVGHMASLVPEKLLRLYHIMLFTLPGTPFISYGDEIGLKDLSAIALHSKSKLPGQAQKKNELTMLSLFKELSALKSRELSLLHGEFHLVQPSDARPVYAYLRSWDQRYRFLTVLNFGDEEISVALQHKELPDKATVVISSDPKRLVDQLHLQDVHLAPCEGLLLKFPYSS